VGGAKSDGNLGFLPNGHAEVVVDSPVPELSINVTETHVSLLVQTPEPLQPHQFPLKLTDEVRGDKQAPIYLDKSIYHVTEASPSITVTVRTCCEIAVSSIVTPYVACFVEFSFKLQIHLISQSPSGPCTAAAQCDSRAILATAHDSLHDGGWHGNSGQGL
jgi:hypothetical protein